MAKRKKAPELTFQEHIADFLIREHKYGVLEQSDITDTEHFITEDQLWAFLNATQGDTLKKLAEDYGTDAREEVFRALRKELEHTPLWMILRHGLKVRGLEFRLYYPKPRSMESAAAANYSDNRITLRPHFYFGEANQEIDFVLFLNGLPIVALEVKHEKNQNVHNAVEQFTRRDKSRKIFQHPFLYLAADTSDVMAATDPSRAENFRWHNTLVSSVFRSVRMKTKSTTFSLVPGLNRLCNLSASQQMDRVLPLPAEWSMRYFRPMSPVAAKWAAASSATLRTIRL